MSVIIIINNSSSCFIKKVQSEKNLLGISCTLPHPFLIITHNADVIIIPVLKTQILSL